jgi:hypothetical protein
VVYSLVDDFGFDSRDPYKAAGIAGWLAEGTIKELVDLQHKGLARPYIVDLTWREDISGKVDLPWESMALEKAFKTDANKPELAGLGVPHD